MADGSFQSLEALPVEHLQIVFVASSSCSEDDAPASSYPSPYPSTTTTTTTTTPAQGDPACPRTPSAKKSWSTSSANGAMAAPDVRAKTGRSTPGRASARSRERPKRTEDEVLDAPPDGWPLRRVISIEEDHLPHLLQGGPLMHQLSEGEEAGEAGEEEEEAKGAMYRAAEAPPKRELRRTRSKKRTPASPRRRPVGRESQRVSRRELIRVYSAPLLQKKKKGMILTSCQFIVFIGC